MWQTQHCGAYKYIYIYLVGGFNHLENISQWEGLSHILWKLKNVWNHQPYIYVCVWKTKYGYHTVYPHIMCKLCSVTHGTLHPIFPSYKNKTSICSWLRWDSYILILHHILHTVRSIGLCYSLWFSLCCYCNDKQITTSNIMHNLNHKDNNIAQKCSNI